MAKSRFSKRAPDPSPAHEARESKAMEAFEHRTGQEAQDERKVSRGKRPTPKRRRGR